MVRDPKKKALKFIRENKIETKEEKKEGVKEVK